jgi:hypothetical protein
MCNYRCKLLVVAFVSGTIRLVVFSKSLFLHAQKRSGVDKPLENIIPVYSYFLIVLCSLNTQTFVMIDAAFSLKLESDVGIYMLPAFVLPFS